MVADYSTDFQRYLGSVCTDDKYIECQEFYTPTDAVDPQPVQRRKFPLRRLNLGLQVRTVVPKEQEGQASEKVEQLPVLEGLRKHQDNHVLLVGRPGSGKSTALERLLWEEAQRIDLTPPCPPSPEGTPCPPLPCKGRGENYSPVRNKAALFPSPRRGGLGRGGEGLGERSTRGHAKIPVLVELRQYQTSVLDLIQAFLLRHELRLDIKKIKTLLDKGQFLLLLDGLNELPTAAWRDLQTFEQTYRQTAMIFTSRDVGRSLGRIKTLEMQALNEVQMRQFVCTYLPESGEEMLRQLGSRLRELGQTPLLLWMLCSVYAELGRVPTNLGAAFRAFAEIYDNQLKANVPTYQESQYWWSRLLKHLAFKMLQGESLTEPYLTISKPEAERVLRDFLQGKVAYPDDCAVRWLEDLLKYHLLQRGTDNRIEFRHQLIQEYYAGEYLGERLADISNERLTWEYLNYLKWTEPLALMLALVEDEAQVVRVVRLALEVDLQLGARLAGEVKLEFQEQTVGLVIELEIPQILRVQLLGITRSNIAIPIFSQALENQDSSVRFFAAKALGQIANEATLPSLSKALKDEEYSIRRAALDVVAKIGTKAIIPALIQAIEDENAWISHQAIYLLRDIGGETEIAPLVRALDQERPSQQDEGLVRGSALSILGKICDQKEIAELIQDLKSRGFNVNSRGFNLIKKNWLIINPICGSSITYLRLMYNPPNPLDVENMRHDATISNLCKNLANEDHDVRRTAVYLLGQMGTEEAINTLCKALESEQWTVRMDAVHWLGEIITNIDNNELFNWVLQALEDKNIDVKNYALYVLEKIGIPELLPRLSKLLLTQATHKNYWLIQTIPVIQERCRYYNYAIATSAPPQEQTTANPLSHTLENLNQTLKTMTETPKYDFSSASFSNFGSVTGDMKGGNIIGTQYNYPPEQKQNLAEAAKEIQQLLDQLAQTNPTLTESNNPIVVAEAIQQEINRNPTFKQRLRSALKAGGIEALKAIFNHQLINIPIETIKGWIEAE